MTPLEAAWLAHHHTEPTSGTGEGICARCAAPTADGTATPTVVSKTFTSYDTWHTARGPLLCAPCAWAYTHRPLRLRPLQITQKPQLLELDHSQVLASLSKPLPGDQALTVPLQPGRKHLLPDAAWGLVTVDNATLQWTPDCATRLEHVTSLRSLGFPAGRLSEPVPPFELLRRIPTAQWADVLDRWSALDPWRPATPWMALALKITAPTLRKAAA